MKTTLPEAYVPAYFIKLYKIILDYKLIELSEFNANKCFFLLMVSLFLVCLFLLAKVIYFIVFLLLLNARKLKSIFITYLQ